MSIYSKPFVIAAFLFYFPSQIISQSPSDSVLQVEIALESLHGLEIDIPIEAEEVLSKKVITGRRLPPKVSYPMEYHLAIKAFDNKETLIYSTYQRDPRLIRIEGNLFEQESKDRAEQTEFDAVMRIDLPNNHNIRSLRLYRPTFTSGEMNLELVHIAKIPNRSMQKTKLTVKKRSAVTVTKLVENGDANGKVDIVFLGDGFTANQMDDYRSEVDRVIKELFNEAPWKSYKSYFNIRRLDIVSDQTGAGDNRAFSKRNALGSYYNCNGIGRLICISTSAADRILNSTVNADEKDIRIVIVNDSRYGGSGGAYAVQSMNQSIHVYQHELGHHFANLADEYEANGYTCDTSREPRAKNITIENSFARAKWRSVAGAGLFEGGKYCSKGIFRPHQASKMRAVNSPWGPVHLAIIKERIEELGSPGSSQSVEPTVDETTLVKAPAEIKASQGQFSDHILVSWTPVKKANSYLVQRKAPHSSNYATIKNVYKTSFQDKAVKSETAYSYRIVSLNGESKSDPSDSPTAEGFITKELTAQLSKVIGLRGFAKQGVVTLEWESVPKSKRYQIQRWDNNLEKYKTIGSVIKSPFTDTKPILGSENYYRVRAKQGRRKGPYSIELSVNVKSADNKPGVVSNISASAGEFKTQIVLRWGKIPEAKKYLIYRYDFQNKAWGGPFYTTKTSYSDKSKDVQNGQTFAYTIAAIGNKEAGPYSEYVYGNTRPGLSRSAALIKAPKGISAAEKGDFVNIKWKPVANAIEYYVFRKKENDADYTFLKSVDSTTHSTSVNIPKDGNLYFFILRTQGELGESVNSKPISAFRQGPSLIVKKRALLGDGLENFLGSWQTKARNEKNQIKTYQVLIERTGNSFAIELKDGNTTLLREKGSYISQSHFVRTQNFSIHIKKANSRKSKMLIQHADFTDGKLEKTFFKKE